MNTTITISSAHQRRSLVLSDTSRIALGILGAFITFLLELADLSTLAIIAAMAVVAILPLDSEKKGGAR